MPVAVRRTSTSPIQTVCEPAPERAPLNTTLLVQCGWSCSTKIRCSRYWPPSAKNAPSSSAEPPGPEYETDGTMRTIRPPIVTTAPTKRASRPTCVCHCHRWVRSAGPSMTESMVSSAPSPTSVTIEPLTSTDASCTRTTVARAWRPMRTSTWPYDSGVSPRRSTTIGLGTDLVGGDAHGDHLPDACPGDGRRPVGGQPGGRLGVGSATMDTCALGVAVSDPADGSGDMNAASWSVGANRHSSSRPWGTGKSSMSVDAMRGAWSTGGAARTVTRRHLPSGAR